MDTLPGFAQRPAFDLHRLSKQPVAWFIISISFIGVRTALPLRALQKTDAVSRYTPGWPFYQSSPFNYLSLVAARTDTLPGFAKRPASDLHGLSKELVSWSFVATGFIGAGGAIVLRPLWKTNTVCQHLPS